MTPIRNYRLEDTAHIQSTYNSSIFKETYETVIIKTYAYSQNIRLKQ